MSEKRRQRIVNPREHSPFGINESKHRKLFMWVPPREKRIGSWTILSPSMKSSEPPTTWPRKPVGPNSIHSLPFSNCIVLLLFFFLSHLLPRAYAKEEIQGIGVDVLFPINSASRYSTQRKGICFSSNPNAYFYLLSSVLGFLGFSFEFPPIQTGPNLINLTRKASYSRFQLPVILFFRKRGLIW